MYIASLQRTPHHRMAAEFIRAGKDLTKQDRCALFEAAEDRYDVQLQALGVVGGASALTAGAIGLTADAKQDDENNIVFNPLTNAAVLTGIGGLSGNHIVTKAGMYNTAIDTQEQKLRTLRHGRHGAAAGAVIGGGSGLLLSLIDALEDKEAPVYI